MWGIGFPANQQRGCVSVPKPQCTAMLASKGVVWTHSPTSTNFLFFLCISRTRTRARTCTIRAHTPGLPNRNTQHAVSRTLSLGFGWREAQFSTPVFGAVIRGLFLFQERAHTCAVKYTERALMKSVHPVAFTGQQMKSVNDGGELQMICKFTHISSSRPAKIIRVAPHIIVT